MTKQTGPAPAPEAGGHLYTSVSAGGEYELLGSAMGAGTLRGTRDELIYRDTSTGQLYRRRPEDFAERMHPVAPSSDHAGMCLDSSALLRKWLAVESGEYDVYPPEVAAETRAFLGIIDPD